MAKRTTHEPKLHRNSSNCFFGCFGFPRAEKKLLPEVPKSGSHRKKTRWLSGWRFQFKKSTTKTVPVVDGKVPGKLRRSTKEIHSFKSSDQKLSSVVHKPVTGEIQLAGAETTFHNNPQKEVAAKNVENRQNIVTENREKSRKRDRRQNGVKPKTVDDLNLPARKKTSVITRSKSQTPVTQLVTLAPSKPKSAAQAQVAYADLPDHKKPKSGKYDSMIGMSVILMTLFIMLLWGKLCAILCTSAWFFVVPRLRATMESSTKEGSDSNLDSDEHKRKVVLEGFLARNRRKVVRFL